MELKGFAETGLPCPCGKSSDAFAKNKDGSGKCFSGKCDQKFFFPKDFWDHFNEVKHNEEPYGHRNVPNEIGEKFGFKVHKNEHGEVAFYSFDFGNGWTQIKRVLDGKINYQKPKDGRPQMALGGTGLYDKGTAKNCVVVEGPTDAAAAYYILNNGMKNETPVYFLKSGGISRKDKEGIYEELKDYERVILAIEQDEAGDKAKMTLGNMLKGAVRVANLNKHKDASDYLTNGSSEDFKRAVRNYSHYTPDYITSGVEGLLGIWNEQEADFYVPTKIPSLDEKIKGIALGHTHLITGQEGLGKTELLRKIEWEVINEVTAKGYGVSVTHFEENSKRILKGYGCYDQLKNFCDPDWKSTQEDIMPTIEKLREGFFITDFYKARDEMSVKSFMEKIEYLFFVCDVRYFFLDPINQLRPDVPEETTVKFLDGIAMEMSRFCSDNHAACVWTAHLTDEGQTRDSRMIAKQASVRIEISRDLEEFDETERNKTHIQVRKNRPTSNVGPAGYVQFDPETFTIQAPDAQDWSKDEEVKTNEGYTVERGNRELASRETPPSSANGEAERTTSSSPREPGQHDEDWLGAAPTERHAASGTYRPRGGPSRSGENPRRSPPPSF